MKKRFRKLLDLVIVILHVAVGSYIIWARPLDHGSWWGYVVTALMIIGIGATAFEFAQLRRQIAELREELKRRD